MIEIIEWIGLLSLPAFMLLDLVHRAQRYDTPRGWRLRALAVTAFAFFSATKVGEFWNDMLGDWSLLPGAALGTGAVEGRGAVSSCVRPTPCRILRA